ncbi:MAG: hypothetical protein Q8T04_01680 [Bacteroidota bacterium]|nr:hypothetical protein [Bacteroidota bacterium]
MKQFYILLFALLLGNPVTQAQNTKKLESFREGALKEYRMFFSQAELTETGQLSLSANENYFLLATAEKTKIMENLTSSWPESLVLVHYGSKNELWVRTLDTGKTNLVDSWDLNGSTPMLTQPLTQTAEPQKFVKHPWFFYIGEQMMYDSDHNINFSLNTRVGFFLLLNKWDLAATYSANFSGNEASDDITGRSAVGLMSKVYFPIKKYNISPNVGGELSMVSTSDSQNATTQSINKSILFGISWFIGFGSVDIGIRTGDEVATMVGFTFFPNFPKLKSKK